MMMRFARYSARLLPLALLISLGACKKTQTPDAYGNFEATETVVSAQTPGQLLWFTPLEGARVVQGAVVGVVDTAQLALQRAQILAQRSATTARAGEVSQQMNVLSVQRDIALRGYERTRRLFDQHAATAPQLDQAERDYKTLGAQIKAVEAQRVTVSQDISGATAHVAQIAEQIAKSRISNPVAGTVLVTYAKPGEFVQAGQPLYKIANLDVMELRAFVTEDQLAGVRVGSTVRVSIDTGKAERRTLPGTVSWVSSEAEFTPTPIQTRTERSNLVYAVKIRVLNSAGEIKIGMPADVRLTSSVAVR
jgi:HlyD family secretion protein